MTFLIMTTIWLLSTRHVTIDIDEEVCANAIASKEYKLNKQQTPIKEPNPKKQRGQSGIEDGNTNAAIVHAVQALTRKMDEQRELLKSFDRRVEANTKASK